MVLHRLVACRATVLRRSSSDGSRGLCDARRSKKIGNLRLLGRISTIWVQGFDSRVPRLAYRVRAILLNNKTSSGVPAPPSRSCAGLAASVLRRSSLLGKSTRVVWSFGRVDLLPLMTSPRLTSSDRDAKTCLIWTHTMRCLYDARRSKKVPCPSSGISSGPFVNATRDVHAGAAMVLVPWLHGTVERE